MAKDAGINIELTEEQQKTIFAIVLFLGSGGFCYWKYFWTPVSARIAEATKKIEDVERKIADDRRKIVKLNKLREEKNKLTEDSKKEEGKLPREARIPELLYTLDETAKRHRIELSSIGSGSQNVKQYVIERSFPLSIAGTYHNVARFMTAFGLYERIFSMRGLSLNYATGGTAVENQSSVKGSLTLVSYQYKG